MESEEFLTKVIFGIIVGLIFIGVGIIVPYLGFWASNTLFGTSFSLSIRNMLSFWILGGILNLFTVSRKVKTE